MRSLFLGIIILVIVLALGKMVLCLPPLVSIIIPVYNRSDLLPRAIDSILNQTYSNWELLVIDDGSTDNTVDIIRQYAAQDKRIRLLMQSHQGASCARNLGLENAQGKYIAYLDSDDASSPDRLAVQVAYLESHPDITLVGSATAPFGEKKPYDFFVTSGGLSGSILDLVFLLGSMPTIHATSMFRRDFIERHHIRYDKQYETLDELSLYEQIFDNGGQMANIPQVLYYYRLHNTNQREYYQRGQDLLKSFPKKRWMRFFPQIPFQDNVCDNINSLIEVSQFKSAQFQSDIQKLKSIWCRGNVSMMKRYVYFLVLDKQTEPLVVRQHDHRFYSYTLKKYGVLISGTKERTIVRWDGDTDVTVYHNR